MLQDLGLLGSVFRIAAACGLARRGAAVALGGLDHLSVLNGAAKTCGDTKVIVVGKSCVFRRSCSKLFESKLELPLTGVLSVGVGSMSKLEGQELK